MMFEFTLASILLAKQDIKPNPYRPPEYIQRYCARQVGIPYASDNFSDVEWTKFVLCVRKHIKTHEI